MALLERVRTALRWVCLALLSLLIATPLAQIVMRSVFNVPMSGAEELARYFMICLVFLGAPLVTLWGGQIGMEEFQALIPARPRWWLQLLIEVAGIALFALVAVADRGHHPQQHEQPDGDAGDAVLAVHGAAGVGSLLLVVETAASSRTPGSASGPKPSTRC